MAQRIARQRLRSHKAPVTRQDALDRLRSFEPHLRARGVRSLYLFGSTARDEADERSDLDLLFDYDPASPFSLFTQADLSQELSAGIGAGVDLIALDGLRPSFRDRIAQDIVRVF